MRRSAVWWCANPTPGAQLGLQLYAWTSSPQRHVQGSLRLACQCRRLGALYARTLPFPDKCCSASAGLAGVRGPPCRGLVPIRRGREASFLAADSLQACAASYNVGSSHKPAAAMLGTRCASQAVQGGARAAVLERAAGGPHCQAVVGAWAAWRAPSFACYIGVKTVLPATSAQTRAWKVVLPTQQSTD